MKVCIPSKGRAETIRTHYFFKPEDVIIFVEPQEIKAYKIFQPGYEIVDIKKSNQGLYYVRNFIIDYMHDDKILMLDDDIYFIGKASIDGHYKQFDNIDEIISDVEQVLDTCWGYTLPQASFGYFIAKKYKYNENIYYYNSTSLFAFWGLNLVQIKKHKIRLDPHIIEGDDLDFSIQLVLEGGKICCNYKYAIRNELRSEGGLSTVRKYTMYNLDNIIRQLVDSLSEKYGSEFVQISHNTEGYLLGCRPRFNLIVKRKDIVLEYFRKYQKKQHHKTSIKLK